MIDVPHPKPGDARSRPNSPSVLAATPLMPYDNLADLPGSVRHVLPTHAQEIYQAAYNSAWDEYADPDERRDPTDTREETAHKVAWAAVKQTYAKRGDRWVSKA